MRLYGVFTRLITNEEGCPEISFCVKKDKTLDELKTLKGIALTIDVKKKREKRSLNANAYYWVLADEIAKQMSTKGDKPYTATDVYREHIKDVGAYWIMPIKETEVERFVSIWNSRGNGWICEDMGKSKLEGYEIIKCYYGSSEYDSEQMSRLIELAVSDAKELGIETLTPEEIEEIKHYENRIY